MFMKFLKLRTDKINARNWLPFSKVAIISAGACVSALRSKRNLLELND